MTTTNEYRVDYSHSASVWTAFREILKLQSVGIKKGCSQSIFSFGKKRFLKLPVFYGI